MCEGGLRNKRVHKRKLEAQSPRPWMTTSRVLLKIREGDECCKRTPWPPSHYVAFLRVRFVALLTVFIGILLHAEDHLC